MKNLVAGLLLLLPLFAFAKENPYAKIDKYAASIGYLSSDELAKTLTAPYTSDSEKVRSIFYWITQHISYDFYEYHHPTIEGYSLDDDEDSVKAEDAFYERYAEKVLKKKMGICEGYSTLFKLLCDKAHITCIKISGHSKASVEEIGQPFYEDHSWNAIKINGGWKLIDACWASGNSDNTNTKFTKKYDDYYYCTPPCMFALNHYPTDSSLLFITEPLSKIDFINYPAIHSENKLIVLEKFSPLNGKINARIGDTLRFELTVRSGSDSVSKKYGSFITEFDVTGKILSPYSRLEKLQHFKTENNKIYYDYKVWNNKITKLCLLYNNNYLLSYRLVVQK
ncbi:hypothetical protein CJD36_020965 [Flavipsychrobacter stenotrophus]|uniref:Transglutaminase-like domain-containing protein n=1 Tax=Flavipsychrobacter stenotrophus TaxID=2077091 RepID=A0A2S7SQ90_9BACT|nr:transglutaminase domain-containing protein [Flavipsychrobacter stenotrophus]PQJ09050.1 hypothetical protein CJD36_020965 [Flavipsychrobacter stenotrophus]